MKPIVERIVDFVIEHGDGLYTNQERGSITKYVKQHFLYGTLMVLYSGIDICAVARWNFKNEEFVEVLDVVIRKDWRRKHLLKRMLFLGIIRYPTVKYIIFSRSTKYPTRNKSVYKVEDLLRRRDGRKQNRSNTTVTASTA